jgi:hypothetical protein
MSIDHDHLYIHLPLDYEAKKFPTFIEQGTFRTHILKIIFETFFFSWFD